MTKNESGRAAVDLDRATKCRGELFIGELQSVVATQSPTLREFSQFMSDCQVFCSYIAKFLCRMTLAPRFFRI